MKKLISIILSLQLILPQVAFSQATKAKEQNESIKSATKTADVGTNAGYDLQSQSQGGYDFYAKQILAISTSIVGANIFGQCPKGVMVPSIGTYMAGSAVHIMSELAGAKAQNENHNKKMSDIDKIKELMVIHEGGQVQKEILVIRKQEEEKTLAYIESRMKWIQAVALIYASAAGLAMLEEKQGHAAGVTAAVAPCTAASTKLCGTSGPGVAACMKKAMITCETFAPTGTPVSLANFMNPLSEEAGDMSCAKDIIFGSGCLAYNTAYHVVAYPRCVPLSPASGLAGTIMAKAIVSAYTMAIGKTGNSNIATYGSMLSGLLLLLVPSLQSVVHASYNYPIPRAVTFGASAVLAESIVLGLSARKKAAEKNIHDLEKVLNEFKIASDDVNSITPGPSVGSTDLDKTSPTGTSDAMKGTTYEVDKLPVVSSTSGPKNCGSQTSDSFSYSPEACKNPMKVSTPKFNMKAGTHTLNDVGIMASDMANAISSGDIDKADVLAGKINSQAANIKRISKDIEKQLNEKLKTAGKKPIDFDKEIQNKLNESQSSFNSMASSKGMGSDSSMSPLSSTDIKSSEEESLSKNENINLNLNASGTSAPEIDLSKLTSGALGDGSETDASTQGAANALTQNGAQKNKGEGDANRSLANEISDDTETSLFKQVSNRYFLNYTKIFQRKEIKPPLSNP